MFRLGDFNAGGAEPDRLYPQASNSESDLSSLGVELINEPENCSRNMARQDMISKTQDQSSSGFFEERRPVVDLTWKMRKNEEFRKFDRGDAVIQVNGLTTVRVVHVILSQIKEEFQILKKLIESLDRHFTTFLGAPVPERINLPNTACIPRTKECPQANTDPQDNEPNNQEPVPGVNTSTQPVETDEVPADSLSGSPLMEIPATDVLSVGRGSYEEEASQKGRVRKKCDLCCCSVM